MTRSPKDEPAENESRSCPTLFRRAFLDGAVVFGAFGCAFGRSRESRAAGRAPIGGSLSLRLPWSLSTIDPHRLDDVLATWLHEALFDGLYRLGQTEPGASSNVALAPALAAAMPEAIGDELRVPIRENLVSAQGQRIGAGEVYASLQRARKFASSDWFAPLGAIRLLRGELRFAMKELDPQLLAFRLAAPFTAIVSSRFRPEEPDGTGPFKFTRRGSSVVLVQNENAALGPGFLRQARIREARDLTDSLRAFEAGEDDIGWHGMGFHENRPDARPFDFGVLGWVVLRGGIGASAWDVPGVMQRVCDGLPTAPFAAFRLGTWKEEGQVAWPLGEEIVWVREDSPWLIEVARMIASVLSQDRKLTVRTLPINELRALRQRRSYALMIDVVRNCEGYLPETLLRASEGRLIASDGAFPMATPKGGMPSGSMPGTVTKVQSARSAARMLSLGVIGEVRSVGGLARSVGLFGDQTPRAFPWASLVRGTS
jgi:hypothetical protein